MATAELVGSQVLDNAMIAEIVEDLTSKNDKMRPLRFLDRTPLQNAAESELYGIWTGNVYAADLIVNDQKAVTVSAGRLELGITSMPNVKIGARLDQAALNRLYDLRQRGAAEGEDALYDFWFGVMEDRVTGVRQRLNALACQARLGTIEYDRLGVKISHDFGVPAALKETVSPLWSDATNATPVKNILDMVNEAKDAYGKEYNRVTMSRTAFGLMVATAEFANLAKPFFNVEITAAALNTGNRPLMEQIVGRLLNLTVEVEDGTYRTQEADGTPNTHRYLPENKVLIDSTEDDNDRRVIDFANAIVTESMVSDMGGTAVDLAGQTYGPVGYWAPATHDLNEPAINAWAVARCFPRRRQKEACAVLTVTA